MITIEKSNVAHLPIKHYRPEVDGLRALAILPVLFFHAGLGFPGGYVGVDIFFVISGFLITSLIHQELERGTFSLVNFWARRARRIVPASLLLTLVVLGAGWFILLPEDFQSLGQSASAQAVFSANLYFWKTSNYFASGTTSVMPLLHTWSLAVEEQFYVFVPLLLAACYASRWLRQRHILPGLLALGFFFSFACSIYMVRKMPTAAFYLLPPRAWEMLLGALLALLPSSCIPRLRGWREAASWLGLAGIGAALFFYHDRTPFPGLAALPPCLGAALIIWSNGAAPAAVPGGAGLTLVGRVLASPGPVFIGAISYSLYLWHWPLFAYVTYWSPGPLALGVRVTLLVASLLLALASFSWVESPFRHRKVLPTKPSILAFAGAGLACMLLLGLTIAKLHGLPRRFSPEVLQLANAQSDRSLVPEHQVSDIQTDRLKPLGITTGTRPALLLWGDSHGAALAPAVDLYCRTHGLSGRAALHSSTTPLLDYYTVAPYGLNERAVEYSRALFEYVRVNEIPKVILAASWNRDLEVDPEAFEQALARTIEAFAATPTKLYIFLQVPRQPANVPRVLALQAFHPWWITPRFTSAEAHQKEQAVLYRAAARYGSSKCVFIDSAVAFASPSGAHFDTMRNGHPLFADSDHMSIYASENVIEPLLARYLDAP